MTRTRLVAAALGALLLLMPAAGAVAQTPEPVERTPEMEQRAAELTALFPAELGDVSLLDDLEVQVGQELLAELDPSDPYDAEQIADIHEIMEAAGATVDDAATAASFFALGEDDFGFVAAYQILGSDSQVTQPLFVAAFQEDLPQSSTEQVQIAGRDVTVLRNDEEPGADPFVHVPSGDTTWLLSVPEQFLEEAVGSFPRP